MFGRLLRQFTGGQGAAPTPPPAAPEPSPPDAPAGADAAAGPVFSSRAVRDATVVTAAVEALGRFAGGQEPPDELAQRLEGLSAEQMSFLQLSAEPTLVERCLAVAEGLPGPKAAAVRRLLAELADGSVPAPATPPPAAMTAPVAAPVMAPAPSPARAAAPEYRPMAPAVPSRPTFVAPARPVLPRAPSPLVPSAPAQAPARPPVAVLHMPQEPPEPEPGLPPLPPLPSEEGLAVPPPAAPPPSRIAGLARLSPAEAEARRARFAQTLSTHLSPDEAAP